MPYSRHDLWRFVVNNLEGMQKSAPDGYEAVATVYIHARQEPLIVGRVETRRDPQWPWVFFMSGETADDIVEAPRPHTGQRRDPAAAARRDGHPEHGSVAGDVRLERRRGGAADDPAGGA